MKRKLFVMVVICLFVVPAMAEDLADQLCKDETFVSMVRETSQKAKYLSSLSTEQRERHFISEEFACFSERIFAYKKDLSVRFNLTERSSIQSDVTKAIQKVTLQTDPAYCEFYLGLLITGCYNFPGGVFNAQWQAQCFADAYAWYDSCMGGVS